MTLLCSYSVVIESMLLKEEFPASCDAMKRDISILRSATEGNDLVRYFRSVTFQTSSLLLSQTHTCAIIGSVCVNFITA